MIQATARGSGYYIVYADGAEYSRHTTEREAMENATEALGEGHTDVEYVHDYIVDVDLMVDADPDPEPPVDPPPPPPPPPPPSTILGTDLPLINDDLASFEICPSCGTYSPDPEMRGDVLFQSWQGVPDSWSPRYPYYRMGTSVSELYFRVQARWSPDWDWGTGNGWSKWFTILSGRGNAWWGAVGAGGIGRSSTQRFQTGSWGFSDQWQSGTTDLPAELTIPVQHGEILNLEFYINLETGRVQAAQDGVMILNRVGTFQGFPPIHELKLGSTLGGNSGLPTLDARYWVEYHSLEIRGR